MTETWAPAVEDVHALIPHRNGGEPWNNTSQPTAAQVDSLIDGRVAEVLGALGGTVPVTLKAQAAHVVKLGVAADIELAYRGVATGGEDGAGPSLLNRYETSLERLVGNADLVRQTGAPSPAAATAHAAPWGAQPARPAVRIWDR